ncbi:M1 family metallopeptidase [Paraliomyxa miuraensis]|uniref:M1 family metallopeptidase n=1 Tax=Paraliomyxa miuraensis TaxID=376150 RepID=UPI0022576382|nr:M1 family metallopeptidase [Paraliomyxa miuraensis]MCX4242198.1 M1 family metallopeptidase [Paraliomyxa miuraensis]
MMRARPAAPWLLLVPCLAAPAVGEVAAAPRPVRLAPVVAPGPSSEMGEHGPSSVEVAPQPWPQGPRSPRNANYTMQVRFDPGTKRLQGTQVLRWTNITEHPTQELRYHLYYNAWRNDRSSWLRRAREQGRGFDHVPDDGWAFVDVSEIQLRGAGEAEREDLSAGAEFIAPDDGNLDDRTVLRVPLPRPVEPGQTIEVELRFDAKLPRTFARTGFHGDYVLVAQWFPKVGVLRPDGQWACHQFIQTEFFADFGVYDVSLELPAAWVVGATGRELETQARGEATVHRFVQEDVHDFAWTASPHFSVHERRFEVEGLPPVDMRLLLMPDHAAHRERYFAGTVAALEHYGRWWGPYAYDHITIVDPAYRSKTGGMEYPTLFTGGTRWQSPLLSRSPEGVTVHEAGHQFWYGMVANDEFEHAWLDEGFNTYSTTRTLEAAFPAHARVERYLEGLFAVALPTVVPPERTAGMDAHAGMHSSLKRDPQSTPSWRTGPGGYHVNAYNKGAATLRTLEGYLGWTSFQRVMSTYFRTYAFSHPEPQDFFAVAELVSGQRLKWFFDQVWDDTVVFDYAVGEVASWREDEVPLGYADVEPAKGEADGTHGDRTDEPSWHSAVTVRRWGEGRFPLAVEVTFSDGTRKVEHWDGQERWHTYRYEHPGRVDRVRVDPGHVLVLDTEFTNNAWLREAPAGLAATKWASKWMLWVQHAMEGFAFFA